MREARVRPTPEDEHLAGQERLLEELTDQLATKETEFATLGLEFARFRGTYLARFAPLYVELDRLEAEIARLRADRFGSGSAAAAALRNAQEAEARAQESAFVADSLGPSPDLQPEPSGSLKALYRDVAKMIHPDLAGDDAERKRRTRLMAAATEAYATGDERALHRILAGEVARPEAIKGDDTGARLIRTLRKIAQIRGRFTELVELRSALENDPMWQLFDTVRTATANGGDPLRDTEQEIRRRIHSAVAQLAALQAEGNHRPAHG